MLTALSNLLKTLTDSTTDKVDEVQPSLAAAVLMFEVVWADHNVEPEEITRVSQALQSMFDLSSQEVDALIEQTKQMHETSVGVFPFTRAINEHTDQSTKIAIVEHMWRIAYSDNTLDVFEEHTIRRIADLLYVSHKDFIGAKLRARERDQS